MKILLTAVNAKYIHSNPAVYSLKAYAAEFEHEIQIAEYTINNRTEAILADLYRRNPDVIAFSCYIWNWTEIKELLKELPKVLPHTDLWLGGPEVSYDAMEILKEYPALTGIMIGEGEQTFLELVRYYEKEDRNLTDIKGLALSTGFTGERELTDLDKIPFFYHNMEDFTNRIVYYESSRGCPFRCSYCLSSIDKTVRFRSFEKVKCELQFFLNNKVPQVKFVDRTFNCKHEHAMAVWKYILEHDNGVTNFHFEISADLINGEELKLLNCMRPGLVQLEIGVQSTNPETIREIHRTMNLDRLREVVEKIHKGKNIHTHLDLIAGLPFEDYESFQKSFADVYAMRPKQLQLGFLKILKGSCMHDKVLEYGINYRSIPNYEVLYSKWLPYDKVLVLKRVEEMVELYYNSSQFTHTLRVLELKYANPFSLYEELAAYYEEKGYFINSPARVYRYEILLQFAVLKAPEQEDLFKELLTYDIYLREKCKSRPAYCLDLSPYQEKIREKQKEKTRHTDVFFYPVWEDEPEKVCIRKSEPLLVQFNYEKRNPLTKEASIQILED